jgi:hypothetical protein
MVTATAFVNPGYDLLVNQSSFNAVNASYVAINSSSDGFAWLFLSLGIIYLPAIAVYIRSQNIYPAVFVLLLMTTFMDYYGLLNYYVAKGSYTFAIITVAITLAYQIKKKSTE